ncbi:MAG TPA: hypothetical protein VF199_01770 [Bacillales bacterium]
MGNTTTVILAIIGFIVFFGLIAHFQTGYFLKKWLNEIQNLKTDGKESFLSTPWIGQMVKEYEHYRIAGTSVNSQALIEKYFFKQPVRLLGLFQTPVGNVVKMLQQLPSFSIIIGVLGTFIGLTMSMFSMQNILLSLSDQSSVLSVSNIVSSISQPFQGMSIAFLTSIAGIGGALFLTILQAGFFSKGRAISYLQAEIAAECESFLDHELNAHLEAQKPQDTMEKLLDRLVAKVEESFQKSVGSFGEKMTHFTGGLEHAMEEVQKILTTQREYSEAFGESTEALQQFGGRFSETVEKLGSVNSGMERGIQKLGDQVNHFEKQLGGLFKKRENDDRRMEQVIQRSDMMMEQSNKKTEELGEAFLHAMNQQMQQYNDQYDSMERKIGQQQDEWYFRYQEKQDHYQRAADAFGASVQQLEKAIYDMAEKMKRDLSEQINTDRERQSRMQMDRGRDDMREVTRAVESLNRDLQNIERYLEQFYQVVLRMYEDEQRKREPRRMPSQIME